MNRSYFGELEGILQMNPLPRPLGPPVGVHGPYGLIRGNIWYHCSVTQPVNCKVVLETSRYATLPPRQEINYSYFLPHVNQG